MSIPLVPVHPQPISTISYSLIIRHDGSSSGLRKCRRIRSAENEATAISDISAQLAMTMVLIRLYYDLSCVQWSRIVAAVKIVAHPVGFATEDLSGNQSVH